jgi:glycosyltransferase involved in cell wall biosynthesis
LRTLYRAHADVYLASGAGIQAGLAYDAARLRRSKYVFFAASDKDLFRSLPALKTRRERWWYLRALRGADARVAQTDHQRRLFQVNFGVDAQVIVNPVQLPPATVDVGATETILWLSTYKPAKRPQWFLDLARSLPQFQFVMVGFPPSPETNKNWREAREAAMSLPNLEVHGFVEHSRIGEFFRRTALFVHTSALEGFPNTLLESWSYGIPTISAVDPDRVIERHRLGAVVASFDELMKAVVAKMRDPDERRNLGARARRYVERYHAPARTFDPVAQLLDDLILAQRRTCTLRV